LSQKVRHHFGNVVAIATNSLQGREGTCLALVKYFSFFPCQTIPELIRLSFINFLVLPNLKSKPFALVPVV
jgi:hypothetical protein